MNYNILENYIDRVYGYAVKNTYSREEADELSQEILLTVMRSMPNLKDNNKFEPWLWGVAANVVKGYRRNKGRQRSIYVYNDFINMAADNLSNDDEEEIYNYLRAKITMLSEIYRNIVILHYYDGLSIKQIAAKLNLPDGTVTWRLSEARKKLKKECEHMEYSALYPKKMKIRIIGEGDYNGTSKPFPHVFIEDALSQNILYYCYEQSKSVEQLSKLCGVPAFYIEERLDNLLNREAVSVQGGKYLTEFIIYSDKVNKYTEDAKCIFEPVLDRFVNSMMSLASLAEKLEIYRAEKSEDELLYLFTAMALEHLSAKYNPVEYIERPVRYDGCRWSYIAHLEGNRHLTNGFGRECSANLGGLGTYQHISYHFGGFSYRSMMQDREIKVCEDILRKNEINDVESAAMAIEHGYVVKREEKLFVTAPAFTKSQYAEFKNLVERAFEPSVKIYAQAVTAFLNGYRKLFPKHLEKEVTMACRYMFLSLFAVICKMAQEKGMLKSPGKGSICDVLLQNNSVFAV